VLSVGVTFYKYGIKKDYLIIGQAPCDQTIESCFYIPCADGDDACDPANVEYYKKVERKAFNIKLCDPMIDGCDALTCAQNEQACSVIPCEENNLSDGEECSILNQ
jgi:hypothetical protein